MRNGNPNEKYQIVVNTKRVSPELRGMMLVGLRMIKGVVQVREGDNLRYFTLYTSEANADMVKAMIVIEGVVSTGEFKRLT